jgi:anthranilate phosphoribosyltransferase
VYEQSLTEKMALVLKRLGSKEAFVVCGEGTFDEISICGPTKVSHLKDDDVRTFEMTPEEYGFKTAAVKEIVGGDAKDNAIIVRNVLDGEKSPKRDMVLLNASAAFVAAGLCDEFKEGIKIAVDSIDSGNALKKLDRLVEVTAQCGPVVRG